MKNTIDIRFVCESVISGLALIALIILISENNRMKQEEKKRFYIAFSILTAAAVSGCLSLVLNGHSQNFVTLHAFIKSLDYILFPCAAVATGDLLDYHKNKKLILTILLINALFELASIFTGWSFYIDETYYYVSGPYHFIYHISIIFAGLYMARALINYGKSFEKENRRSLIALLLVAVVAVILQEIFSIRIMFVGIAFTIILLFIHLNEFSQVRRDADLAYKNKLLSIDALTGLGSRYSYNDKVKFYEIESNISDNLAVTELDMNGLKTINDELGHLEGDKAICEVSNIIIEVFENVGECYRTGGDEFIVFTNVEKNILEDLLNSLKKKIDERDCGNDKLSVSVGSCYVKETKNQTIESAIKKADERMYEAKNNYYILTKKDRRKNYGIEK